MSCFRCGKELPEGQVECDPPCDEPNSNLITFSITINLRKDAINSDKQKFETALERFSKLLEKITMESGLHEFGKLK